jgi:predicted esterase
VSILVLIAAVAVGARIAAGRSVHRYSGTHGARIERYTLESRLLRRSLHEIAVVPSGGDSRGLLVLLHGRHDRRFNLPSWLWPQPSGPDSVLTDALLEALAGLGARAPVVVLLDGGQHSYYHDRRDGPWGSMVLEEGIPDAVRRFHTARGRVAIGGISMGGYGALYLAARDPGRFCAAGGHSAALWEHPGESAPGAFDDADDFAHHDVFALADALRRVPVWIDTGTNDWFHDADLAFADLLQTEGVDVRVHVWPGSHERAYWDAHMRSYLHFYAGALARCSG